MAYTKNTEDHSCLNCGSYVPEDARFCPNCGQKVEPIKIPFTSLISEFFETIFNVDSGLLPTLKKIWVPGQLTIEFFRGKRKRYIRPIRLLLFTGLIFLTVLGFHVKNSIDQIDSAESTWSADQKMYESALKMNEIHSKWRYRDTLLMDTVYTGFLEYAGGNKGLRHPLKYYNDSTHLMEFVLDSISVFNFQNGKFGSDGFMVSEMDAIRLTPTELCDYYSVEGFFQRLVFIQTIKSLKDLSGLIRSLVGSVLWMFFLTIPSMALVLFILKGIGSSYYIEHLIFTIHAHSLYFLAMSIGILIDHYMDSMIVPILFPLYALWLLISLRRYYKKGWFRTIINFFLLNFTYSIVALFAMLISGLVGFLLF